MVRYSFQPKSQIFVKGHGFLSFAKKYGYNTGKKISKNLNGNTAKNF